jgi:hypothetical protein
MRDAVAAELTKARSLQSVAACSLATVGVVVALAAGAGWSVRRALDSGEPAAVASEPAVTGLAALEYAQLGVLVLGVLVVTSEHAGRTLGVSLLAVPRRGRFYLAKLSAGALVALAVATPTVLLAYLATQAALGPHAAPWDTPGLPRALAGGITYLVLFFLLAAGVAAALRNQVLTLAVLLPLFAVATSLARRIPGVGEAARLLPDQAGIRMTALGADAATGLPPTVGGLVMLAWTTAALTAGWLTLRHRDV